jgi:methionyl-tRNA formyltransferase
VRLVYLGTSEFAAEILRRLAATGDHRPVLAVSPPDRRRGRGRKTSPTPVAAAAEELGIEVLKTEATEDDEALERIRAARPEVGVVCAFGQLIREPLLSELELLNVHPSLLPRWRGAAPIERSIMAGDAETGVSIMRLTAGLDSGPVALQRPVAIGDADYGELASRLEQMGGELLVEALDRRAAGSLEFVEQDDGEVTYAEKIEPGERRLDPGVTAVELERRVRALNPHVGTYLELADGERLGVLAARARPGALGPGEVEVEADAGLRLGTADGVLSLLQLRPAGGKAMDAAAYLRGHEPPAVSGS